MVRGAMHLLNSSSDSRFLVLVVLASCLGSLLPLKGILLCIDDERDTASGSSSGPGRDYATIPSQKSDGYNS